jgi:hypothetical protein
MPLLTDTLNTLREQGAPESHMARLKVLVELAGTEPAILAIVLVGSYAKGIGDRVSDLDLVAIASPGHCYAVMQAAHEKLAEAEVLNRFSGTHPNGGAFSKFVYMDFASVEFHVFETGTTFRLKRPYLPIWDPNSLLSSYVTDGEPIRHEDFAAYEYGDAGLIWELVDCIKWLLRGRTELAHSHILKLAAQLSKREPKT